MKGFLEDTATKRYMCKLSLDEVKEIRVAYKKGVTGCGYLALAKEYGVTPPTIKKIIEGKTWANV